MATLITGGAGFIGSHLANKLVGLGEIVIVVDDESTGNFKNLEQHKNLKIIPGSILDKKLIWKIMPSVQKCFHLAAAVGVKKINDNPLGALEINIQGTENILKSASSNQVRTFLASSSEVYGKNPMQPLSEISDRLLGGTTIARWSYSESKAIDEFLAIQLFRISEFPVTIGRLFNTVGPLQVGKYGMVLPNFVNAAMHNKPLQVFGDGTQIRTFSSVSDVIEAMILLMNSSNSLGEIYNIGGSEPISIIELAKKVIKVTKSSSNIEFTSLEQVYGEDFEEPAVRIPDISKLKSSILWEPKKNLDQIIYELFIDFRKKLNEN